MKEPFYNFGLNSWGPPFGKIPVWPLKEIGLFGSLGGFGFYLVDHRTLFLGVFRPKADQRVVF